ncbi:PriCT-2 domain-containing protein, partial [bacterium]|nr:PriCT-2 domain-containing protein [bacterium]
GMALHHASGGSAFDVWDKWSQMSKKYDDATMPYKWHSFGRSANPVTLGTLAHYAEQGGWVQPVTFTPEIEFDFTPYEEKDTLEIDIGGVDLLRPPGLAGQLASWIETRARRKREQLAAMAAITAMGNIFGLRYIDDLDRATTNLFVFNVAGSGTGKEAVQDAIREIMVICGMAEAVHGTIKSEQEVMRNLLRHHRHPDVGLLQSRRLDDPERRRQGRGQGRASQGTDQDREAAGGTGREVLPDQPQGQHRVPAVDHRAGPVPPFPDPVRLHHPGELRRTGGLS